MYEKLPDDCLPFNGDQKKLAEFLRGPKIENGVIQEGLFAGMTPAQVEADRRRFDRGTVNPAILEALKKIGIEEES